MPIKKSEYFALGLLIILLASIIWPMMIMLILLFVLLIPSNILTLTLAPKSY